MKFKATLDLHGKSATGIKVPPEIVESLNGGKRPLVKVTLKKHTYRTVIAPMRGLYLIPVSAEIRATAGVEAGELLNVAIELDTEKREYEIPEDLAKALKKHKAAAEFFAGLAPSHKKEWVRWITEAKKQETRDSRVAKAIEKLSAGVKTH